MASDGGFANLYSTERDRRTGYELLELLTGWAMLEAALWTTGREQVWLGLGAMAVMAAFNVASGVSLWEQGFSPRANWKALWLVPMGTLIAGAMLASGAWAGTLHPLFS